MPGLARFRLGAIAFFGAAALATAQSGAEDPGESIAGLRSQIQELRAALDEVRGQLAETQRESQQLRQDVAAVRGELASVRNTTAPPAHAAPDPAALQLAAKLSDHIALLAEDQQVAEAKLKEQDQSKVASGSRYHVRVSGMALLTAASTRGAVD